MVRIVKILKNPNILFSPSLIFALILFSFNFKLSNNFRWLIFLVYILLFILLGKMTFRWLKKRVVVYFALSFLVSLLSFQNNPERALQFLSFGYDNAFQFSAFRGFNETSWYPNVDFENWFTDFQLFKNVPMGHSSLMSFLLHPFTFIDSKTEALVVFYAAFQLFSIFLLIFLVHQALKLDFTESYRSRLLGIIFSILIVTCIASTIMVNGFAPYYWTLVFILFWLNFEANSHNTFRRNFTLSCCIYSVSLVTPAPATLLFFPAFIYLVREYRVKPIKTNIGQILGNVSPFILFAALVLFTFLNSTAGLGWRQLLKPGGIQNINPVTSVTILSITCYFLIRNRKHVVKDPLALIVISGLASSASLSALTFLYTGNLQYYAIKHIYLTLFFSSIYLAKGVSHPNKIVYKSGLFISILIYPIIFPKFYTAGYMGVLPNVLKQTFSSSDWGVAPVNAELILNFREQQDKIENKCYIWRIKDPFTDKDLSSRWLNAMYSQDIISESCFSAYWNNGQLSDEDFIKKLSTIENSFVLFVEVPLSLRINPDIEFVKVP